MVRCWFFGVGFFSVDSPGQGTARYYKGRKWKNERSVVFELTLRRVWLTLLIIAYCRLLSPILPSTIHQVHPPYKTAAILFLSSTHSVRLVPLSSESTYLPVKVLLHRCELVPSDERIPCTFIVQHLLLAEWLQMHLQRPAASSLL